MKVVIVEGYNVADYPPIINLIENLINHEHMVVLISCGCDLLPDKLLECQRLRCVQLLPYFKSGEGTSFLKRIKNRIFLKIKLPTVVKTEMQDADVLWTTSFLTIRMLGRDILKYKNVMQLMELIQKGYRYRKIFRYPIENLARKSWKVVVPEENRAYIEKTWWHLKRLPYVLPNKPYNLDPGSPSEDMLSVLEKMKKEKRRILLYLGVVGNDRELIPFVNALNVSGENYCIYIVGRIDGADEEKKINQLLKMDKVEYLGFFSPPKHLLFLQYAFAGLLPYKPMEEGSNSALNALYCAPNKIFEYAGYGVPMIGSDVLGLKYPFEKYNIGKCCKIEDINSIVNAIKYVEKNHSEMSKNCKTFYDSVDLDAIVEKILSDE